MKRIVLLATLLMLTASCAGAQCPPGYYWTQVRCALDPASLSPHPGSIIPYSYRTPEQQWQYERDREQMLHDLNPYYPAP